MPARRILALWATPRSRSTAFERMMAERGDFAVLHEPFQQCAYFGPERLFERFDAEPDAVGFGEMLAVIVATALDRPVFVKDHAYYIEHLATPAFLEHFDHTFLIRHPRHALPSYHANWPDVTLKETGYLEQAALFDAVVRHTGRVPAVIDGDDLVRDPEGVVRAYCQHTGLSFLAHALRWEARGNVENIWHRHLATTHGFEEQRDRPYRAVEDDPHLESLYRACLPAYEHLWVHRLGAPAATVAPVDLDTPGRPTPPAS